MSNKEFDLALFKRRTIQCIRKDLAFSRLILETTSKDMTNQEYDTLDNWLFDLEEDVLGTLTKAQG